MWLRLLSRHATFKGAIRSIIVLAVVVSCILATGLFVFLLSQEAMHMQRTTPEWAEWAENSLNPSGSVIQAQTDRQTDRQADR